MASVDNSIGANGKEAYAGRAKICPAGTPAEVKGNSISADFNGRVNDPFG